MQVQIVAEQKNNSNYVHVDTEYFSDADSLKDWLSGAMEWADRFRIFKIGDADFFFEAVVVNHKVSKWQKISMSKLERVDLYA